MTSAFDSSCTRHILVMSYVVDILWFNPLTWWVTSGLDLSRNAFYPSPITFWGWDLNNQHDTGDGCFLTHHTPITPKKRHILLILSILQRCGDGWWVFLICSVISWDRGSSPRWGGETLPESNFQFSIAAKPPFVILLTIFCHSVDRTLTKLDSSDN